MLVGKELKDGKAGVPDSCFTIFLFSLANFDVLFTPGNFRSLWFGQASPEAKTATTAQAAQPPLISHGLPDGSGGSQGNFLILLPVPSVPSLK